MRPSAARWFVTSAAVAVAIAGELISVGCKDIACGNGTIDRSGDCVPANETVGSASCGPLTVLVGDVCVPTFTPTMCDPATTVASAPDPVTGVVTCIGNGTGGCSTPISCPAPASGKQTLCGQIYNFADMTPFADPAAVGALCPGGGSATGPCALRLIVGDAANPSNTLNPDETVIDDCGRFRIKNIGISSIGFLAVGVDDFNPALLGPPGLSENTAITTRSVANQLTAGLDAYTAAATDLWSMGPTIDGTHGVFAQIFFAHVMGNALLPGVSTVKAGAPDTGHAFYFAPTDVTRGSAATVMPAATVTGANGTALVDNASPTDGPVWSGSGGLATGCEWLNLPGESAPGVLVVQEYRPTAMSGMTCNQ